jgi:hypothetical protein
VVTEIIMDILQRKMTKHYRAGDGGEPAVIIVRNNGNYFDCVIQI